MYIINIILTLLNNNCLDALKEIENSSLDSLVTDPPAGIAFMNKSWDKDKGGRDQWIAWFAEIMQECNRVLKPGAHGFVWALPRTSHWTATALENAGFEIRDIVTHVFGSGFPKSHNISKGIDKKAGVKREIIEKNPNHRSLLDTDTMCGQPHVGNGDITASTTDQAKQWDGWGTALKPASEHWILIRKPLSEKTIVDNVLKHGVGGINIDASRVGCEERPKMIRTETVVQNNATENPTTGATSSGETTTQGRFPANFICSDEARDMLDEQSGELQISYATNEGNASSIYGSNLESKRNIKQKIADRHGASRFFYCAKASKSERGTDNNHPTVKAQKLMCYLIKMVTPPNGTVLDPFMGSGSTGVACKNLGFQFIGIEKEQEYFHIAENRISNTL